MRRSGCPVATTIAGRSCARRSPSAGSSSTAKKTRSSASRTTASPRRTRGARLRSSATRSFTFPPALLRAGSRGPMHRPPGHARRSRRPECRPPARPSRPPGPRSRRPPPASPHAKAENAYRHSPATHFPFEGRPLRSIREIARTAAIGVRRRWDDALLLPHRSAKFAGSYRVRGLAPRRSSAQRGQSTMPGTVAVFSIVACWTQLRLDPRVNQPWSEARPTRLEITARSSPGSTGFVTWVSKPARSARVRSSARACPVSATTGVRLPDRRIAFTRS